MKVAVAMSGGVDSSVAAYLLKEKGYEVIGLTMQLSPFKEERGDGSPACCGLNDILDAKNVAHHLGIRHYVVNFRDIFHKYVIADFIKEYKCGNTPNPCIRCNKYIKFDFLLERAREIDAEFLATGHYSRIVYDNSRKRFLLKKGVDSSKDQSYVLYMLNQDKLKQILMPLGELKKEEVRDIASKEKLPVAHKPESQEICFISGNYRTFLEKEAPFINKPGNIVNSSGNVLGRHRGIPYYTIGQRQGLGISFPAPLYVIGINSRRNEVIVGEKKEAYGREFAVEEVNIISADMKAEFEASVKIRYRHESSSAAIIPLNGRGKSFRVIFKEPQWGITPGQSAVFYQGEEVLGGGIIKKN